uniref:Uncharacterized protein n=1 Tax=Picea glauca TaxID=3330 RepID=A0A117NIZ6_PICGL|nr:hypothetical protein ABT39_MTgene592 [Picea glauca]QHR87538.1 hypothetical protein Q903MT_gene1549 [Picea sitchensis]
MFPSSLSRASLFPLIPPPYPLSFFHSFYLLSFGLSLLMYDGDDEIRRELDLELDLSLPSLYLWMVMLYSVLCRAHIFLSTPRGG